MTDREQSSKVTTEGSARVLNEVKGRLERIEAGELPVIERVGPDGVTRRVDATGEMIRPEAAKIEAMNEAAEAFAAEHRTQGPAPAPTPSGDAPRTVPSSKPATERPGLWARIKAWFNRS